MAMTAELPKEEPFGKFGFFIGEMIIFCEYYLYWQSGSQYSLPMVNVMKSHCELEKK